MIKNTTNEYALSLRHSCLVHLMQELIYLELSHNPWLLTVAETLEEYCDQ